jgi:hypothetical protein
VSGFDVVVGTVGEGGLDADDREASEDAGAHDRLETLGHARDVLLGHGAALDGLARVRVGVRERIRAALDGLVRDRVRGIGLG